MKKNIIIVRGGGDIATGTIYKLHQSGYPVLVTEIANPSAIRRQVAFSEAVYEKSYTVEGVTCYFAENLTRAYELLKQRKVALMIDPDGAVNRRQWSTESLQRKILGLQWIWHRLRLH